MVILFLLVFFLTIATLSKPAYGVMVYIMIRLCIPPSARFFGFSFNTLSLGLLILFSYPSILKRFKGRSPIQGEYLRNYGVYIVIIFFLAIISSITAIVPLPYQLAGFFKYFFTEMLPSIIVILLITSKDIEKMNHVIWISVVFATSYAIFTFFTQSNPLLDMFNTGESVESTADFTRRGGLLGTGVGINDNKITAALHAMLFFTYFWGKKGINRYLIYLVLTLSFASALLTSQRTSILNISLFMMCMLLGSGIDIKKLLKVIIVILLFFVLTSIYFEQFDELVNMMKAAAFFWSDDVQEDLGVHGSSMDLRLRQFLAVVNVTNIHILEGLGYDFNHYGDEVGWNIISDKYVDDLAGFESVVFTSIASSGIIGLVALLWMYYRQTNLLLRSSLKSRRLYVYAFVGTFLLAAIMTNYSGSSYLFFIFLALNLIDSHYYDKNINISKKIFNNSNNAIKAI